jgi:hypothetical protein
MNVSVYNYYMRSESQKSLKKSNPLLETGKLRGLRDTCGLCVWGQLLVGSSRRNSCRPTSSVRDLNAPAGAERVGEGGGWERVSPCLWLVGLSCAGVCLRVSAFVCLVL